MKKSNVFGLIGAVLAVAAVVALISWIVVKPTPVLLQGETNVTSYKASSKVPGRIDKMLVKQGQKVKKGELLYTISIPEVEAKLLQAKAVESAAQARDRMALAGARIQQIEAAQGLWQQAEAGLSLAQKTFERVDNLYKEGVLPAQKHDEALANLNAMKATASAAKAQYEMAKDGTRKEDKAAAAALVAQAAGAVTEVESYVADACVYSPVDGEISTIIAEAGELVGSGYPVVTILDMGDMWVSFNVKETLLPKIKMGTKFSAEVPALGKNVDMVVDYIAVQADFATWSATRTQGGFDIRTFNVKARPASGTVDNLRPGMSAVVDWNKLKE